MYDAIKPHDSGHRRRAEGRALTRQRLCSAAIEEIAERGVAGISIERISERAGLTRGAFYYNYDSKYSLLSDVLFVVSDDEINSWIKLIEDVEDLGTLFSLIRDNVDKFFDEKGLLLVELEMAARRSEEFAAYFRDSERKVQVACEGLVATLARKVGITIDVGLSATMVSSMASGLALGGPRSEGVTRGTIMITFLKLLLET
jgi:AcrR family transcriptional regulator